MAKNVSAKFRKVKVTTISSDLSPDKIDTSDTQSKIFSINSKTNEGHLVTFLFDESKTTEDWSDAIEKALTLLNDHFLNGETDELTLEIKNNGLEKTIYGRLKKEGGEWEFLDIKKIYQEHMAARG